MNIRDRLDHAIAQLRPLSDSARLDAELLLAHVLDRPRSHLHAWPERSLDSAQEQAFLTLLARRAAGEPMAYLLGSREFWSLRLAVTPDTLIPRPETELLVEAALALISGDATWRVADLGTGSGAIALALASERPACRIIATDRSAAALAVASANAEHLGLNNVEFREGNWFAPLTGEQFDVVVSNPPYVASGDPHLREGDVRFEPLGALAAGPDGLDAIRKIAYAAPLHLRRGGWLLMEHGYDQGEAVRQLLARYRYVHVETRRDAAGHPRVTLAQVEAQR